MIVIRRITDGIYAHLPIRVTEWGMAWPAFTMGLALNYQSDMFQTSPSFERLAAIASEGTWAILVLACCLLRIVALTVNGTFTGFGYSPHMRLAASLVGLFFWSRYCLGFLDAAIASGGSWSAPAIYSTAVLFEMINAYRSWLDVLRSRQGK
ncbi:hypothetical protein [Paracoccus aeridis]|uniref:hypothetical protein n=1 Tax=Paracoccus aeridis TaxID=1966466 RepID=UPI0010AA9917|nr:hypothetical protein [Paracoccus aeridis]